jgi:hypothetical protein
MLRFMGFWDWLLVAMVSVQATALAYVPQPRAKALILSLPIPFTLATLALGQPTGISNLLALILLFLFTQGVRILHQKVRVPIILAIVLAATGYCVLAGMLAPLLPAGEAPFWIAAVGVLALAILLFTRMPHRDEPEQRSPLPVWVKLPIIVAVIMGLVVLKQYLQGFMTLFPMVGVVAAYEARKSLWTIGRQIPVLMIMLVPMIAVSHLMQPQIGLGPSLLAAWAVFLAIFLPYSWVTWSRARPVDAGQEHRREAAA